WLGTAAYYTTPGIRALRRGILQHHRTAPDARRGGMYRHHRCHCRIQARPLRSLRPRNLGAVLAFCRSSVDVRGAVCVFAEREALTVWAWNSGTEWRAWAPGRAWRAAPTQ